MSDSKSTGDQCNREKIKWKDYRGFSMNNCCGTDLNCSAMTYSSPWFKLTIALLIALLISGAIVGIAVASVNQDDDGSSPISTNLFSPGDSRILSLPRYFCAAGELILRSNSVEAELYLINSVPPLTNTNSFTLKLDSIINSLEFKLWQYHLQPNSKISLELETNSSVDAYIIRGIENANSWVALPDPKFAVEDIQVRGSGHSVIQFEVEEADEYYIFIHNNLQEDGILVNATVTIDRTLFSRPRRNLGKCIANNQKSCSLKIPYSSSGSQLFLVHTSAPNNANYKENIDLTLHCVQRGWAYALIALVPLTLILVVWFTGICMCAWLRQDNKPEDNL